MTTWTSTEADGIATLVFDRPPRNWMSMAAMTELADLLDDIAARPQDVQVVMLTGAVDGYFIAHADLDDLAIFAKGEIPPGDPGVWGRALRQLTAMPQVSVAAIDGQAWGGGCETALACDIRLGSERVHMAQPEVTVGIIPGAGGTQRLPRLVGESRGLELCVTGRRVFAEEALAIGLVNAILPTEGFVDHAREWCAQITRNPTNAVYAAKRAVREGFALPLADGLRLEGSLFAEANSSDEARELNATVDRPVEGAESNWKP